MAKTKKPVVGNELVVAQNRIQELEAQLAAKDTPQADRIATFFSKKDGVTERTVNSLSETAKHFECNEMAFMRGLCESLGKEKITVREFNRVIAGLVKDHFN